MRLGLVCVLAIVAAGCVTTTTPPSQGGEDAPQLTHAQILGRLSTTAYSQIERTETLVQTTSGADVWMSLYRPADAPGPTPVILLMSPYQALASAQSDCMAADRDECPRDPELLDYFAPRGYAVAFASSPGTYNSGGCFGTKEDWAAAAESVEWLGTQEWSNGKVAMYGGSTDGQLAVGAATLRPAHLATIIPMSAPVSEYDDAFYDGVPFFGEGTVTLQYAAVGAVPGTADGTVARYPERASCMQSRTEAAADLSGDWNRFWEERDLRRGAGSITASVLQAHGLRDDNVRTHHLDAYWNNITAEKRLLLGQWGHEFPQREDWNLIRHRWLDHFLLGIDTGILADLPPVLIEDEAGKWRGIEAFPPSGSPTLRLFPAADGQLATVAPEPTEIAIRDYPRASFAHDFTTLLLRPVATAAGGADALVFETEPLESDVRYTGRPVLHLVASTAAASTHWVVLFYDIDNGDPSAVSPEDLVQNRGFLDTRHRHGVTAPEDLNPGEQYEATIRLLPRDGLFEKGHRIRVVITNNDNWVHQDTTYAASSIVLGPEGTWLELPAAAAGSKIPADALRDSLRP